MPDALMSLTDGTVRVGKTHNSVLWVEIDVPADVTPGVHSGAVDFYAGERRVDTVPLALNVQASVPRKETGMELDFWQSWSAVTQYHDLEPFSEPWWKMVKAYLAPLAESGQDVVQVGRQYVTYRRVAEGEYQFDFTNFDRYVRLCRNLGIDGPIEYLAMMNTTGPTKVFFRDETGSSVSRDAEPGDAIYDEVWSAFLRSLVRHCEKHGWKERLRIFIADRPKQEHVDRFIHATSLVREADKSIQIVATFDDAAVAESLRAAVDRMVVPLFPPDPGMKQFIAQRLAEEAGIGCYFSPERAGDAFEGTMYDVAIDAQKRGFDGLLLSNYARWPDDLAESKTGYETSEKIRAFVYPSINGPRSSVRLRRLMLGLQASARKQYASAQDGQGE